jgi:hypothetical protein
MSCSKSAQFDNKGKKRCWWSNKNKNKALLSFFGAQQFLSALSKSWWIEVAATISKLKKKHS